MKKVFVAAFLFCLCLLSANADNGAKHKKNSENSGAVAAPARASSVGRPIGAPHFSNSGNRFPQTQHLQTFHQSKSNEFGGHEGRNAFNLSPENSLRQEGQRAQRNRRIENQQTNWSAVRNWHGDPGSFADAARRNRREHHHRDWWCRNYSTFILIGGGYYYWNAGWWYPAWGYDDYYSSYSYDGPIFGYDGLPPDQVITRVQMQLQREGYYYDAADGVLGPATRAALANFQRDHGLYVTAAVDAPTMRRLGFFI